MIGNINSKKASEYAAKKKLALQRANQLRAERKALEDREKYSNQNQNRIQGFDSSELSEDNNVFQIDFGSILALTWSPLGANIEPNWSKM